jgi:hypothetical protein
MVSSNEGSSNQIWPDHTGMGDANNYDVGCILLVGGLKTQGSLSFTNKTPRRRHIQSSVEDEEGLTRDAMRITETISLVWDVKGQHIHETSQK